MISQKEYELKRGFRPANIFIETPTTNVRRPYVDVGEYLPKKKRNEVDVVRISLHSTLGDVIAIRVKKLRGGGYTVNVRDEYDGDFIEYRDEFEVIPDQGEIIDVITEFNNSETNTGFMFEILEEQEKTTLEAVMDFVYLDSNIYPDLNEMFLWRWRRWRELYHGSGGEHASEK